ncbi:CRISPR-associated endoribonuclease Cas6 [Limnoraphis robusta Tam1]|uniref:CRISPR-associated endoribonuclease Cas6 n=1 Tax=Limnoraphis robusta CCNP1315 TaxID=3110306 RepID=A0ABU5U396_9CYAN|nr:CRISPR-associated endoribonuclease Cas6 [Limnoraphis robusta]MEA5521663.1 CRISPR-associated endoribonuclease Cas6 [Limnoraphis robusta CCNP1315]MEA5542470.1 CRISPR-associated endoribonuclease Cas6 [Limnoraphis robusta Tam1]MEA5548172.1 CRISPR-associated endoribonuclease Cas6 [Limnoraphis robusta CCNP1324]
MEPTQSKTLHSWVIELGAADNGIIPATLSRAIHGQVMNWLQLSSSEIADNIHKMQSSPFSLSGLIGNRRIKGNQAGDRFLIRISLLDDTLVQPLLSGIEKWGNQPIILGKFPFVFRHLYTLPGTHRLSGSTSYEVLSQTPAFGESLTLDFLSPTSFKQTDDIQTFLLPELVFGSLERRWNQFAPENLQFPSQEWRGKVSAYELKTYALKMEGGGEIGAQGWVKYRFNNSQQMKIAMILAQFAFFSGVGRKTAMGMGQARFRPNLTPEKSTKILPHQETTDQ